MTATFPLRVWFDLKHRKGSVVGHALRIRELLAGVYGSFAIHPGDLGDEVLNAVRDGLTGVSISATPLRSSQRDGVTYRTKAHLNAVSLVSDPAYPTAEIYAIRQARRGEQTAPSPIDLTRWRLEAQEARLRALEFKFADEALERRMPHNSDPRFRKATELRQEIAANLAELEAATIEADRTGQLKSQTLRRNFGHVISVC